MTKQFNSISSYITYSQGGGRHLTFMVKNDIDRNDFLDLFPTVIIDDVKYKTNCIRPAIKSYSESEITKKQGDVFGIEVAYRLQD